MATMTATSRTPCRQKADHGRRIARTAFERRSRRAYTRGTLRNYVNRTRTWGSGVQPGDADLVEFREDATNLAAVDGIRLRRSARSAIPTPCASRTLRSSPLRSFSAASGLTGYSEVVPDLVVEVASPSDSRSRAVRQGADVAVVRRSTGVGGLPKPARR